MKLILIVLIASFIACSTLPPEKDFTTELWYINLEQRQIEWENDSIVFASSI